MHSRTFNCFAILCVQWNFRGYFSQKLVNTNNLLKIMSIVCIKKFLPRDFIFIIVWLFLHNFNSALIKTIILASEKFDVARKTLDTNTYVVGTYYFETN